MPDNFQTFKATKEQPADKAFAVNISVADFVSPEVGRGLYIGGGGDIEVTLAGDPENSVTFLNVVAGTILPIRVVSVIRDGTDASDLVILV